MWITLATALANPARESAVLPGTAAIDGGHGHVGFIAGGVLPEPFSIGGLSLGVAPFRGAYLDATVLQSPDQSTLHVAQVAARVTLIDTDPFALALFGGALWFEEGLQGTESSVLAGGAGIAMRIGQRPRSLDVAIAPASVFSTGTPGNPYGPIGLAATPYALTVGWTRPLFNHATVRIGWPDGVTLQYRVDRAYLDVSLLAVGVPIWGGASAGLRF